MGGPAFRIAPVLGASVPYPALLTVKKGKSRHQLTPLDGNRKVA